MAKISVAYDDVNDNKLKLFSPPGGDTGSTLKTSANLCQLEGCQIVFNKLPVKRQTEKYIGTKLNAVGQKCTKCC